MTLMPLFQPMAMGTGPRLGTKKANGLRGDIVGILTAQYLHATTVVTPVNSNSALERTQSFAQVIRTRIGSPYVIDGMQLSTDNVGSNRN
jgi:phosphomannomutase